MFVRAGLQTVTDETRIVPAVGTATLGVMTGVASAKGKPAASASVSVSAGVVALETEAEAVRNAVAVPSTETVGKERTGPTAGSGSRAGAKTPVVGPSATSAQGAAPTTRFRQPRLSLRRWPALAPSRS